MQQIADLVPSNIDFSIEERFGTLFESAIRNEVEMYMNCLSDNMAQYATSFYNEIIEAESLKSDLENIADGAAYNITYSVIATLIELEPLVSTS